MPEFPITDPALRHLGPRTPRHPNGQEFILSSAPLHDAVIAQNRMLSLEQLGEALKALHQYSGATLKADADPHQYVKYLSPGKYMVLDEERHIFLIHAHETEGWETQFKDEHWYTPERIATLAA